MPTADPADADDAPFVSDVCDFSALQAFYAAGNDNEVFLAKIEEIKAKHRAMRRVRGDGNCFYRSVLKDGVRLSSRTHLLC